MNSKKYLLIASVIYFGIGVFLVVWFALPKQSQIQQKETKVAVIDEESLGSSVLKQFKEKADKGELLQFGNIPVTVDKGNQGKDNPFAQ